MEKMEKLSSNSPFMLFYAMNFDHRITYVLGQSNMFVFAYQAT